MGRKKKKPFFEKVTIEDIGAEGKAIARVNDLVVFTKYAIPGDVVNLQVTKMRKRYAEAIVTDYIDYSNMRVSAFCEHFGVCGGCKWQFMPYENQLHYKQKQVSEQFLRIGKLRLPAIAPVIASLESEFYRNKLEFTFSNRRWLKKEEMGTEVQEMNALGFHVPGLYDKVINIEKCWLQPEPSNGIRNFIFNYAVENQLQFFDIKKQEGLLRTLIIRTTTTGEVMVIVSFFYEAKQQINALLSAIIEEFPSITSLLYVINQKGNDTITDQNICVFHGRDFIIEEMGKLKFKIGPKSFYQTNSRQAQVLYNLIPQFADFKGTETVYDLYTGTGTIANFIANNVRKVIGIEYVEEAVEDARANSVLNEINNAEFFSGDIRKILDDDFLEKHGRPEIIITDPPRAGMHADVVNSILKIAPQKIIYVSCNPATQARDLALLEANYTIARVQPVDMFPHTHHIENVVLMERVGN
ncbi:MAG: 23S rRNA (uracil(1939)-C(5))-methyltransferase RlmD [Draconibacterium sp.]|nr:MAG: 23S rRNA (uracil(1939)-C(5))-methyltransferase RlmD [Draconibacterium sp.]